MNAKRRCWKGRWCSRSAGPHRNPMMIDKNRSAGRRVIDPNHGADVRPREESGIGSEVGGGSVWHIVSGGREPIRSQHMRVRPRPLALVIKRDVVVRAKRRVGTDVIRVRAAPSHEDLSVTRCVGH